MLHRANLTVEVDSTGAVQRDSALAMSGDEDTGVYANKGDELYKKGRHYLQMLEEQRKKAAEQALQKELEEMRKVPQINSGASSSPREKDFATYSTRWVCFKSSRYIIYLCLAQAKR